MPSFYQEGDLRIITTDSALIAYPYPNNPRLLSDMEQWR